ncbi:hypothetical protein [Lichenihabitans psoromatis]|uniref:hypothetical protein n=1 Tax=Lichenihabitans psoromatis TaxID=2528642 RepID=UPI0010384D04|nr:hypothetical protein [Lichenihabitans psoromatis]
MTGPEFETTLASDRPPHGLTAPLLALWWDRKGDWDAAHRCVADDESPAAAWVHAYLHRREGDAGNAAYWYARADKPIDRGPLAEEAAAIRDQLLRPASQGEQA